MKYTRSIGTSPRNVSAKNSELLKRLARAIKGSQGEWSLHLVSCNYKGLHKQIMQQLREECPIDIQEIDLPKDTESLHKAIKAKFENEQLSALIVFGLESVKDVDATLKSAKQDREQLSRSFQFPVFLWINESILSQLVKTAPDFADWAAGPIKFEMPTDDELIDFIKQTTDKVFDKIEKAGAGKLLRKIANNLNLDSSHISDLKSAYNELKSRGINIKPELEASLEFTLGLATEEFPKKSLRHYRRSLKIWSRQQSNHSIKLGCLLSYLGRWYRNYADIKVSLNKKACGKAKNYYQESIKIFEQCNRQDLVAKFINALGDVLQRLEKWNKLENVAKRALELYPEPSDDKFRLARAYGFFAQVAKNKSNKPDWNKTQEYAEKALNEFKKAIEQEKAKSNVDKDLLKWEIGYHKGWYLLPLAQAQKEQNQIESAIENLKIAKKETKPEYDPNLYIEILQELQKIYFNQDQYLEAFQIKKTKLEIEQQFGFRAFIGIGKLQPKKEIVNPAHQSYITKEKIAPEIIAFNRKKNVDELVERIAGIHHRLTVIYGFSGSGKSSILRAGLIPELKQKTFATRDCMIILQQDYTDWISGIGKSLKEKLRKLRNIRLDIAIDSETILKQLNENEESNLLTVLIFDNLEEFFANNKDLQSRKSFYTFLQRCLKILRLKVVLSLREDSLHHLLEFNRVENENLDVISKDILSKNILYFLGNVSPEDVKSGLNSFRLQAELINKLLEDLAGTSNKVLLIELKVVLTQLENLKIQTLQKYRELGDHPKEILVEQYLEEICQDCGAGNKLIAELLFYLLTDLPTDENNSRPLKSRDELVEGLELAELSSEIKQLDEVLQILVKSDLVAEHKANDGGNNSYQLVHDYFVSRIHNMFGKNHGSLLEKINRTRKELKDDLAIRERELAIQELNKLNLKSRNLSLENKQLEALKASVEAGKKLNEITDLPKDVKENTINILKQIIYSIDEYNNLNEHESDVYSLSFSPDAKFLASASWDKTVKLWDVDSGKLVHTFAEYNDYVNSVQFSPDGQLMASATADWILKIWHLSWDSSREKSEIEETKDKDFKGHEDWVWDVCFNPDGQILASASGDTTIKLWYLDGTPYKIPTLKGHINKVYSIHFSPDDHTLASAGEGGEIRLWNIDSGDCFHIFRKYHKQNNSDGHKGPIKSVRFSLDGTILASASEDHTIKLWNVKDGDYNLLQTLEGHGEQVNSVSFRSDGKVLASGGNDNTIKIWSIDGDLLKTLRGHRHWVRYVEFSPDRTILASASDDSSIKLWKLDFILPTNLEKRKAKVHSVCFSRDGQTLASAGWDGTIRLWCFDKGNWNEIKAFNDKDSDGNPNWVWQVSFSRYGLNLASGGGDNKLKIWNLQGDLQDSLEIHGECIHNIRFSPDGKFIASASGDETVKIWDFDNKKLKATCEGHTDKVWGVSFSPDSKIVASASGDKTIKLWSLEGKCLETFEGHRGWVNGVIFSRDGKFMASASNDRTVKIWDLEGNCLKTLEGHNGPVYDVGFSPDGQLLASVSADKTIKIWSLDGTLLKTLEGHQDWVNSIMFNPDSSVLQLASASNDGTVKLWDLSPIRDQLISLDLDGLLKRGEDWLRNYRQATARE